MDMTSNFFVLCINVKVYLCNNSLWVELIMNISEYTVYAGYLGPELQCLLRIKEDLSLVMIFSECEK